MAEDGGSNQANTAEAEKEVKTQIQECKEDLSDKGDDKQKVGDSDDKQHETKQRGLSKHVWNHVTIKEQPDGTREQTCKYCPKTKCSKQLQTTFWTKHLVDPSSRGCPSCPMEVRQELALKSRSADVHRAAGHETEQTKAAAAAAANRTSVSPQRGRPTKKQKLDRKSFGSSGAGQPPTIVCLCGSQRAGSFNKMLRDSAIDQLKTEGVICKAIDLAALKLPLYDPDLESDKFPDAARQLKHDLRAADGILICSPEYNGFIPPLLLNAITWATRGEGRLYAGFKNKVVLLMSASPGAMGGMRMLRSLQTMMQDMGAIVVPANTSIGNAFHVFNREGRVVDERASKKIVAACYQFVSLTQSHASRDQANPMEDESVKLASMGEYGNYW